MGFNSGFKGLRHQISEANTSKFRKDNLLWSLWCYHSSQCCEWSRLSLCTRVCVFPVSEMDLAICKEQGTCAWLIFRTSSIVSVQLQTLAFSERPILWSSPAIWPRRRRQIQIQLPKHCGSFSLWQWMMPKTSATYATTRIIRITRRQTRLAPLQYDR